MARVHGRIHGRVHMYSTGTHVLDRVHGRVQAVHGLYRPRTRPVHGRVHAVYTDHKHSRVHFYTAVYRPYTAVQGLYTAVLGRVHGP